MRRIAIGCTTEAHPLYGVFLGWLSQCIFQWSKEDLDLLKMAKGSELKQNGIPEPSDEPIIQIITKKGLATHCHRKTSGVDETTSVIQDFLETFSGDQGCDTLGVPLLDPEQIWASWDSQKKSMSNVFKTPRASN